MIVLEQYITELYPTIANADLQLHNADWGMMMPKWLDSFFTQRLPRWRSGKATASSARVRVLLPDIRLLVIPVI